MTAALQQIRLVRLLIIEDDEMLRSLATELLSEICEHIHAFENADDALVHMLSNSDDVGEIAIVDQNLHGQLTGSDFASMIHERWPAMGVILSSGSPLPAPVTHSLTRFVLKPWSLDQMHDTIQELLQAGVARTV